MSTDLRDRLRRVLGPSRGPLRDAAGATADAQPDDGQPPATDRHNDVPTRPGVRERDVQHLVSGAVVEGPLGTCFVAERTLTLDHRHGHEALSGFFGVSDQGLGCLARVATPLDVDRESIVFLDTETTGLAGGTGTYAFMVGLAYFRSDRLILRQFFMRDHAEEPAMLAALARELARHEAVVTFNGKSFDVPLLITRYTANRQRPTVPTGLHLDLLHPSRRFWRERLEACNLGTLERAILGHERGPDVPGWMIPDLYFQYVRGGRPEAMAAVFEHNRHDILSLIALTCRLGRLLDGSAADVAATAAAPVPALRAVPPAVPVTAAESLPSVADLFAAARIYEDLGLLEEACSRYEQALAVRRDVALRARVATRLAAISKRVGRHERAVQLWRRLATLGLTGCEPFVELAKHYEHRAHDYDAAIQAVEEALAVVELQVLRRQVGAVSERAALHHRLARLVSKRDRQRGRSLSALA